MPASRYGGDDASQLASDGMDVSRSRATEGGARLRVQPTLVQPLHGGTRRVVGAASSAGAAGHAAGAAPLLHERILLAGTSPADNQVRVASESGVGQGC